MHRKNYDQKIITQFDIVGSFFVDTFYNDLYLKAKDAFAKGRAQSLTDAYRGYITQYVKTISAVTEAYMKVVKNLHEYYQKSMSYPSTLSDFIDSMVSKFIPPLYYRDFTPNNKDRTLHEIIIKTTNLLGTSVTTTDMMQRIIDDHRNPGNVNMLQDMILDIFLMQREEYYSKFTKEIVNENDKVPMDVYNKMKSALKDEMKKRTDCEIERDKLIGIVNKLLTKCNELSQVDDTGKLQETEYKLQETERKLQETEYKLRESERKQQEAERKLGDVVQESERMLGAIERKLREVENKLRESERNTQNAESKLRSVEHELNETEYKLGEAERKLRETSDVAREDDSNKDININNNTKEDTTKEFKIEFQSDDTEEATYDPWN
jgi:hypothetical protein